MDDNIARVKGWRADVGIAVASALAGAIVAADIHWTLRPLVVLSCMIAGPGWALGGLVELSDRALARVICCALGVSVDILVALAMVGLGAWHPEVAAAIMLEVSAAVLLLRSGRVRRRQLAGPIAPIAIGASDPGPEAAQVDVSQATSPAHATVGDDTASAKAGVARVAGHAWPRHLSPDGGVQAYPEPYPRPQSDETKVRLYIPGREIVHVAARRGEWVQVTVNGDVVGWVNGQRLLPPVPTSIGRYAPGVPVPASRRVDTQMVKIDVLVGALAGVGVLIGALLDWTQGVFAVNSFRFPVAFLFDPKTTSRDPRLGYLVLTIGLLGVLVSFLPRAGGLRVALGLLALIVAVLYCRQLAGQLSASGSTASFTDVVGAGPWVTGVAGIVLAVSPLLKSGFST